MNKKDEELLLTERIQIKTTKSEKEMLKEIATKEKLTISSYIRHKLLAE